MSLEKLGTRCNPERATHRSRNRLGDRKREEELGHGLLTLKCPWRHFGYYRLELKRKRSKLQIKIRELSAKTEPCK